MRQVGLPAERREHLGDRLGPHLREEAEEAGEGQRVAWIHERADEAADILDVRLLKEAHARGDHVGNLVARELELQLHCVEVRAV